MAKPTRLLQGVGGLPLLAAAGSELMLLVAWWLLSQHGEAPFLGMALWIWPLAWLLSTSCGLVLQPHSEQAARDGVRLAGFLLRDLVARLLLVGVPAIVSLYALAMLLIAWRVTR